MKITTMGIVLTIGLLANTGASAATTAIDHHNGMQVVPVALGDAPSILLSPSTISKNTSFTINVSRGKPNSTYQAEVVNTKTSQSIASYQFHTDAAGTGTSNAKGIAQNGSYQVNLIYQGAVVSQSPTLTIGASNSNPTGSTKASSSSTDEPLPQDSVTEMPIENQDPGPSSTIRKIATLSVIMIGGGALWLLFSANRRRAKRRLKRMRNRANMK
ncbi:MAG: hypothetical protein QM571_07480 [Micrococcaceae bacterium]